MANFCTVFWTPPLVLFLQLLVASTGYRHRYQGVLVLLIGGRSPKVGGTDPGLGVCSTGSEPGKVLPPPRHQKRGSLGQALRPHSVCPAVEEPLSDVETLHVSIWHVGF